MKAIFPDAILAMQSRAQKSFARPNLVLSVPTASAPGLTAPLLAFAFLSLLLTGSAASAQDYSYRRSGGSRVVQNGNGLANPSSTYITRGTLSPSAQVPVYGSPSPTSPNLPSGAIKYPGRDGNGNPVAQPNNQSVSGLPVARMGSTVGTPGDYMRSDLNPNFSYQQKNNQPVRYVRVGSPQPRPRHNQALTYPGTAPRPSSQASSNSGRYVPPAQYTSDQSSSNYKGY